MPDNWKREGVSLRTIHKWLIVSAVILTCFMIYSTYRLAGSFMHVKQASEKILSWKLRFTVSWTLRITLRRRCSALR